MPTPKTRDEVVNKFIAHFHEVFEQVDRSVKELFDEAVADGEDVEKFVYAKLKLRSYEIFQSFDRDNQNELLSTIDELIYADGSVHPAEEKFREEIEALLDKQRRRCSPRTTSRSSATKQVAIDEPTARAAAQLDDHPFFQRVRAALLGRSRAHPRSRSHADLELMHRVRRAARSSSARAGAGKLAGKQTVADFAGSDAVPRRPRLRPSRRSRTSVYELTVLGDLHGCYSVPQGRAAAGRLLRQARGVEARHDASPSPSSSCSATTSIAACSATTACCAR